MAIKIQILGTFDPEVKSSELMAAKDLKAQFESDLINYTQSKGYIYILPSWLIFGQKRKDIDMLVFGFIEGLTINNNFFAKTKKETNLKINSLDIESFVVNIEVKSHSSDKIKYNENSRYIVYYTSTNTIENASNQAEEAMFSVLNHLSTQIGINSLYMCNMIWFRNVSITDLNIKRKSVKDNAMPNTFSFKDFISNVLLSVEVYYYNNAYHLNSFPDGQQSFEGIKKLLLEKREPKGLTKKKFELLSIDSLGDLSKMASTVGSKLTITTGRAGTGKTIQLLQLAFYMANDEHNKRCLILTYNNALVSDIQRLIDYTPMPSKVDSRTVCIKTINSFFHSLMESTGAVSSKLNPNDSQYQIHYADGLKSLLEFVGKECNTHGVDLLKEVADQFIDWDYIFIDEAQDVSDIEKDVLFKVYGPQRIVIADGVDQFVCGNEKQIWDKGIKRDNIYKPRRMDLERRQKTKLVRFANAYAHLAGLDWEVQPNKEIPGGTIKVYSSYSSTIHSELVDICKKNDCENYDILILEPPCMIKRDQEGSHFALADVYRNIARIDFFDGTNYNNRTTYPTKNECRLYQYHSCRGLEGWCVVCDKLDLLYDYLVENYQPNGHELGFDLDKIKSKYAFLWTMMPLTRPIDTLVITLSDPNSKVGKIIKKLADDDRGLIEWYINQ